MNKNVKETLPKKILLVSNAFFPEISPRSFRATELAKEFIRKGHNVTVFTKKRDFDYSEFLSQYPLTIRMWRGNSFRSFPQFNRKPFSYISRAVNRILLMLFEYPAIEDMFRVKKMLRRSAGYDLMISFAVPYPVHWGVARARTKSNRIANIWVADCGDPYMGDILDSFRKPFYFAYLEKAFCRRADYISIPVETAKPAYYPEFHPKIRIIPQGFEFELENREKPGDQSGLVKFAYAGRFLTGIRDPGPMLKHLVESQVPFRFYVFTDQPGVVENHKSLLGERLVLSTYIPRADLMKFLTTMDFLINFDNNTTLNVPSKLIDYAITGRPVLNIGKEFKPDELDSFLNGDYSKKMKLPEPSQYHIRNVSEAFLKLAGNQAGNE